MLNKALKIPSHIAFIMDGNGRWAAKRHLPRKFGHKEGARALKNVVSSLKDLGVRYATFYAFSTENWGRPKEEVDELMRLFDEQLDALAQYEKENVRLRFIGDRTVLSQSLKDKMEYYENGTSQNTEMTVIIAINYGGHDEITRAAKVIAGLAKDGYLDSDSVTEDVFQSFLDTRDTPSVDLLVRTGGEKRLSNFLLWQSAYAELHFCDTLWPDFDGKCLKKAIEDYTQRDRRFGKVDS